MEQNTLSYAVIISRQAVPERFNYATDLVSITVELHIAIAASPDFRLFRLVRLSRDYLV